MCRSQHQDSGLDRFTVMLGFPSRDGYDGAGVFSHAVRLSHPMVPPNGVAAGEVVEHEAYDPPPPIAAEMLHKRGGAHGGTKNWKARWCQLIGSTLYYSESQGKTEAKGHVKLVGLGVRKADVEANKEFALAIFWPEQPSAGF